MNSVFVLCVGMLGAAPASLETNTPQPVQVAANYGILPGGCYQQTGYRSPLAQNAPTGYSVGTANCPNGWCGTTTAAARPYSPVSYSQGTAHCPSGHCHALPAYGANPATCYGPNCPQHGVGSYSPATYDSRYNTLPATRFPASFSQPRSNFYPVSRPLNGNWSGTSRSLPANYYGNSNTPFFKE